MKTIFITGATGFVGGAIVENLLNRNAGENLLMLVRAENREMGLKRLIENLAKFDIAESRLSELTVDNIVVGDLATPEEFIQNPVLDSVTHVINCAAIASFGKNPLIWKVNVTGTLEFVKRMNRVAGLKQFIQVGTAMACVPSQGELVQERDINTEEKDHIVAYTYSKATIEQLIQKECPNLPLLIVRPSIIVGHSKLGCQPSSSIYWVFEMVMKLGKFLCTLEDRVDIIPVDFCAEAIVFLLDKGISNNEIFHISAGEEYSVSFREIDAAISAAHSWPAIAPNYQQVEFSEVYALRKNFNQMYGDCNERLMLLAMQLYGSFAQLNVRFDNHKLLELGVTPPQKFTTYIDKCVATTSHLTVPELMIVDFK